MKEQEVFFGDIRSCRRTAPSSSTDGTCHCVAASPLARRLLRDRQQRSYFSARSSLPRQLGRVRVRQKNTSTSASTAAQVLGHHLLRALGLRRMKRFSRPSTTVDTINVKDGKLTWNVVDEGKPTTSRALVPPTASPSRRGDRSRTRKISAHTLKAVRGAKIAQIEIETSEFDAP